MGTPMMKRIAIVTLVLLAGCASMLPVVTQDDVQRAEARWPGITKGVLEEGRQKYVDRCGGCHSLHLPSEYTESEWKRAVESMQTRAKVTPDEKEKILTYLFVTRMR
jgi:hypothetical protein